MPKPKTAKKAGKPASKKIVGEGTAGRGNQAAPSETTAELEACQPQYFDESWDPDPLAVASERVEDEAGEEPIAVTLRHPQAPFRVTVDDPDDCALQAAALYYLQRATELAIEPPFALPPGWIAGLAPVAERVAAPIAWVPFERSSLAAQAIVDVSFASFRISAEGREDRTALLTAAEAIDGHFLGSGFGVKTALHLRALDDGRTEIRILGLTALLPPRSTAERRKRFAFDIEMLAPLRNLIAPLISPRTLLLQGIRLRTAGDIDLRGVALAPAREPPFDVQAPTVSDAIVVRANLSTGMARVLHRSPLIADATNVRVFERVPPVRPITVPPKPSNRPTGRDVVLDGFRVPGSVSDPLEENIGGVTFTVLPAPRFVHADPMPTVPTVPRPVYTGPPPRLVRSNDASAVQGFHHVRDLFVRLKAYGIDAAKYFRFARPEVLIAYRSGISPGPDKDGQGVNARVMPDWWDSKQVVGTPGQLPRLFLLLALADRRVRARGAWAPGGGPMQAEPLGIGADANWMWHEFGHVLAIAATGELELRFAHSPGDALAAIVADSRASAHVRTHPTLRFTTFPWVCNGRRHDRKTGLGWGWNGPIHAPLAQVPNGLQPRRKGYQSEQILSSSLFRLYRCLGGDTDLSNDAGLVRQTASHYAVYLIMRALQNAGSPGSTAMTRPSDFVRCLHDADGFFSLWKATYLGVDYARMGGTAGKLIAWAFEAQGLGSAATDPYGPAVPKADVYIASRRPTVDHGAGDDTDYGPGSYVPVSLEWQAGAAPPPAWQADATAVVVAQDGTITVTVGNRGTTDTAIVTVDVWWADWPAGLGTPPDWNTAGWKSAAGPGQAQAVQPGASVVFGPFAASGAASRYVVLARATCTSDPALIDDASLSAPTPIIDLVAGDNNLALLVVD